ncbi:MAG: CbiX/SirB N-terminal domain-containing protein [Spirochaetes bacterium]|nr:CbiX/SirB N-terminal domain-containing protein [Spirochaetota bacterium]
MKTALLVLGHGSRSKDAIDVFDKIVKRIQEKGDYELVRGAHMELARPDIPEAVSEIAGLGANRVIMVPYFLYEGIHIKKDIPEIIEELKAKYKDIEFIFARPIGFEPLLADILLSRAKEADK